MRAHRIEDWIPSQHDANLRAAAPVTLESEPIGSGAPRAVEEGERPFWVKSFDVLAVGTLFVLLLLAGARLAQAVAAGDAWWLLAPVLPVAVLCADLVSGLVHWIGDRFFSERTPVLGAAFVRPFREHHRDPLAITRHGFFELCGNNAFAVVLPVALLLVAPAPGAGTASVSLHAFVIFFALAVFATNLFHKWAHAPHLSTPVRWLQASGAILSPERHARHHRGDYAHAYCVTTGWLNPVLDALDVLPRCERWLRRWSARWSSSRPRPAR